MDIQPLLADQDDEIDKLSGTVTRIKGIAIDINSELGVHEDIITDIENNTDRTNHTLISTNRKVNSLRSMIKNNKCNICMYVLIVVLIIILIVLISQTI